MAWLLLLRLPVVLSVRVPLSVPQAFSPISPPWARCEDGITSFCCQTKHFRTNPHVPTVWRRPGQRLPPMRPVLAVPLSSYPVAVVMREHGDSRLRG
ncbi:hypothetical protein HDK64DRAFT_279585, partial [Phyllosticta capitalensis]